MKCFRWTDLESIPGILSPHPFIDKIYAKKNYGLVGYPLPPFSDISLCNKKIIMRDGLIIWDRFVPSMCDSAFEYCEYINISQPETVLGHKFCEKYCEIL